MKVGEVTQKTRKNYEYQNGNIKRSIFIAKGQSEDVNTIFKKIKILQRNTTQRKYV